MSNLELQEEVIVKAPNPSTLEEVLDTRSVNEIEAELVKKADDAALEAASKMAPEDRAAIFFQQLYPQYENSLHDLKRKELISLAAALVHYPLENLMPKTRPGAETLMMGLRLTDAKLVMRETIAIEERKKLMEKESQGLSSEAQEIVDNTVTSFEQGEEVNE